MAKPITEYRIGDEIWRHVDGSGTFRYIVDGIRTYPEGAMLEVECQTCSHGWKCRVLLAKNDDGRIHAVHMLNDDEDGEQRIWHTNEGLHFWPTKAEARDEGLRMLVRRQRERVTSLDNQLDAARKRLASLEAAIGSEESK